MSRGWFGRRGKPAGRHAANPRDGAARPGGPADSAATRGGPLLGAPTAADAGLASPVTDAGLVSPVTDAARIAAAATAAGLPAAIPPSAAPLITIDALGRKCPIPVIMLAAQIRDVPVGSVIAVLADDPAAYSDIPAWCVLKSHECVFRADLPSGWSFGVRREY